MSKERSEPQRANASPLGTVCSNAKRPQGHLAQQVSLKPSEVRLSIAGVFRRCLPERWTDFGFIEWHLKHERPL